MKGLKAQKAAALQAKKEGLVLSSLTTAIEDNLGKITKSNFETKKTDLNFVLGLLIEGI